MRAFDDHFAPVAGEYARFRPRYPAALFAWLAGVAPGRALAWDCATGSGQAAVGLAKHFTRVIATDASAAQIAAARACAGVEYRRAPAERSGLDDHSVDLVTVAQALHWIDRDAFHAEVRRVARPAGVLAVWSYGRLVVAGAGVDACLQSFYRDTLGPYWPPERAWVDSGYRDLQIPFPAVETPAFTMAASWTLPHLLGYLRTWSATARYLACEGVDPVAALRPRLAAAWGEPRRRRAVRWPLTLRVSRLCG